LARRSSVEGQFEEAGPQGLKPRILCAYGGTTEVVPFQNIGFLYRFRETAILPDRRTIAEYQIEPRWLNECVAPLERFHNKRALSGIVQGILRARQSQRAGADELRREFSYFSDLIDGRGGEELPEIPEEGGPDEE
jgi:hypothetical protein